MNIIIIMDFFVMSFLYFSYGAEASLKIHNFVVSHLLCMKYKVPKLLLMLGALCVKKTVVCDIP